jgi:hypothetical protein
MFGKQNVRMVVYDYIGAIRHLSDNSFTADVAVRFMAH